MYLALVLTFRFILRRDVGSLGIPDVLFIVIVADAAQNAMAGEYKSIADGIVLVATLVFWNVAEMLVELVVGWEDDVADEAFFLGLGRD